MQTVVLNGIYFPAVDLLSSAALAVVLAYGGHLYFGTARSRSGRCSPSCSTCRTSSTRCSSSRSSTTRSSRRRRRWTRSSACSTRSPRSSTRPGAPALPQIEGTCGSRTSASRYGRGAEVLHGIDLDVPAGTTVALVGHTGAGKSTIAKLLARFYDPTRRTDHDRRLRPERGHAGSRCARSSASSRRRASSSPAPSPRTSPSARPDATPDEIVRAAQTVGAHEFVLRLEDGYETELGERGSRLSLGQRQLVAFARALLADPRILILDEATSSVDIGTERKIEQALRVLLADRTAFIIAHRLSTIRDADLIVVLEHGRDRRAGLARGAARPARPLHVALRRLGRRAWLRVRG